MREPIPHAELLPNPEENIAIAVLSRAGEAYREAWGKDDAWTLYWFLIGPTYWHRVLGLVPELMERVADKIDRGDTIDWHAVRMGRCKMTTTFTGYCGWERCTRRAHARGLCRKHFKWEQAAGKDRVWKERTADQAARITRDTLQMSADGLRVVLGLSDEAMREYVRLVTTYRCNKEIHLEPSDPLEELIKAGMVFAGPGRKSGKWVHKIRKEPEL